MKKLLVFAILLFSLSSMAIASEPLCGVSPSGVVEPASSEICPQDVSLGHMYKMFPTITHDAVKFYSLKNGTEIISNIEESGRISKSSYAIERYVKYSAVIIFNVIKIIWVVQLVLVMAATIKDKKLGGDTYGGSGLILRLATGVLLFVPYGDSGTIGTLVLMGAFFLSLGLSNIFISTVGYFYQNWTPKISEDINTSVQGAQIVAPRFVAEYSKALTEGMICYQHSQLAFFKDKFVEGNKSIKSIYSTYGFSSDLVNDSTDNNGSPIAKRPEKRSAIISLLPNLDAKEGGSLQCAKFGYDFGSASDVVREYVSGGGDSWSELSQRLETDIINNKGLSSRDSQEMALSEMSGFYRLRMMKSLYKDLDKVAEIANEVAEVSRARYCVDDALTYTQSREAIIAINQGKDPSKGFDLRCAKFEGDKLSMFADIDKPYMNPDAEGYKEDKDLLRKELLELYRLYTSQQQSLFLKLIEANASSIDDDRRSHLNDTNNIMLKDGDSVSRMREYGLAGFSLFFLSTNGDFEKAFASKLKQAAFAPTMELNVDEKTMLPNSYVKHERNQETSSGFFTVKLPYSVKSIGQVNTTNKMTEGSFDEKDAGISDVFNGLVSNYGKYLGIQDKNSFDSNSVFEVDPTSLTSALLASLTNALFHLKNFINADFATVGEDYMLDGETETSAKQRFMAECLSGKFDSFRDNTAMMMRCEAYQRHPVLSAQELGRMLLMYAGTIFLFQLTVELKKTRFDAVKAKRRSEASLSESKVSVKQRMFNAGISTVTSSSVISNIVTMLTVFGVFFAFILPLAPNVIFIMMYMGWFVYTVITFILSPLLFMSFVILKGKDESSAFTEKNLINVGVNLILKPLLILVSFVISWLMLTVIYRLTLILFGTYIDSMAVNITGGVVYDFFMQLFCYIALMFALYKVMYWAFTKPPQVLNMLMDRLGGENVISKENAVNGVLGVMGYAAMVNQVQASVVTASQNISNNIRDLGDKVARKAAGTNESHIIQSLGLDENTINVSTADDVADTLQRKKKLFNRISGLERKISSNNKSIAHLEAGFDKLEMKSTYYREQISYLKDKLDSVGKFTTSDAKRMYSLEAKLSQNQSMQTHHLNKINSLKLGNDELRTSISELNDRVASLKDLGVQAASNHVESVISMLFELEENNTSKRNILKRGLADSPEDPVRSVAEFLKQDYLKYVNALHGASSVGGSSPSIEYLKAFNSEHFEFSFGKDGLINSVSFKSK